VNAAGLIGGHFPHHLIQHRQRQFSALLDRAEQQQAVHHLIDPARDAIRVAIKRFDQAFLETGMFAPTDLRQPVTHVMFDLVRIERFEMVRSDDPLTQLFQIGMMRNRPPKFGLAQQQALQQRVRTELEIGQHPQFFQRAQIKVLAFVHHQKAAPPGAGFVLQETFDRAQCAGLVLPFDRKPEGLRHDMHHFVSIKRAGHDLRHAERGRIDPFHQMRHKRRFARANLAGDDDKAFTLRQAIAKIAHRFLVAGAFKIELRVGGQLKRPSAESVILLVHEDFSPSSEIVAQADQRGGKGEILSAEIAVEIIDRNRGASGQPPGNRAVVGQ